MRSVTLAGILLIGLLIMIPAAEALDGTIVSGTVVDANGEPVEGARVWCGSQETLTVANGSFSIMVADGEDAIIISADGFREATVTVDAADLGNIALEPRSQGPSLISIGLIVTCGVGIVFLQLYMTRRR